MLGTGKTMDSDTITEVTIDDLGRLCITPKNQKFPHIYRAAIEVNWDAKLGYLHSPKPREWTYLDWYKHIVSGVASEYGCSLRLNQATKWVNIPSGLRADIENWDRDPKV